MLEKFFKFIEVIFALTLVKRNPSSIVPEKPLVEVEALPAIAPKEEIVAQEVKTRKINTKLAVLSN